MLFGFSSQLCTYQAECKTMQNKYRAIAFFAAVVLGQLTVACNSAPEKNMQSQNAVPPTSPQTAQPFSSQVASAPAAKPSTAQRTLGQVSSPNSDSEPGANGESYDRIEENTFQSARNSSLSTFSIEAL